ncbi:acetyl-CoA carboxylase biotin carboxyl carrier protein [Wenyingzhuangia sp. 2_MG-2023]|uniref:acetyl-CoA carboxylase biotin carboxyl carrier protein n=1 Tax=Wenyingzhuangia sp. 2_MG-2023 TaxID=3062639 RepID=UPI0026E1C346|nr:acetyl-CoA carboxylase biotin carboxyl carrier protein [Wenyingzhuangia sp. 2_MG-2023]MDO6738182.1 acetyl-CoA carboxylase biotin carboxyl carrier protein [Wenyingzhuangia sp. 2_MG-2023]MDO6801494.1 acetyl-CoA carboxylase biotin carboxyl carrier protein [Wenyingzhuangia sp. 1_MG-2023]
MELKDIQNLIKFVARSGANEVKLEMEDIKITIKTGEGKTESTIIQHTSPITMGAPVAQQAPIQTPTPVVEVSSAAPSESEDSKYVTITSPMIGTFYRKPSPDKALFVEVGDTVQPDSIVCVIEAMKLFNEIESEVSGKIVKILVEDSTPVEFGQPLFLVDPS